MRIAVIGMGHMGSLHAKRLTEMGHRVVTVDPYVSADFKTPVMLDGQGVAGVIIASPSNKHVYHAYYTLTSGIPTLIEKPVAISTEEADELDALVLKTGTLVMGGHIERFNPTVILLRTLINEPHSVNTVRTGPHPGRPIMGGIAYDLLPHDMDLARIILGQSTVTCAIMGDDEAQVFSAHGDRKLAHNIVSWKTRDKVRSINVDDLFGNWGANMLTREITLNGTHLAQAGDDKDALTAELESFVAMIRGDHDSEVPISELTPIIRSIDSMVSKT